VSWVTAIQPVSEFDTIAKSSFYNNALWLLKKIVFL
jgi:hypothetical protein